MLGERQKETLVLFLDAIAALCAPSQDQAKIEFLKEKVDVALTLVERDFPLSLQVHEKLKLFKPLFLRLTLPVIKHISI